MAANASPRAAAVKEAAANEALYYGGGGGGGGGRGRDGGRLDPSTLTPAYSGSESAGGGWWNGHERREDDAYAFSHQQHDHLHQDQRQHPHQHQHEEFGLPQRHAAGAPGEDAPESPASPAGYTPRRGAEHPRSPSLRGTPPSAGLSFATRGRGGGGVSGGGDIASGSGVYDARSQIQRIVDDAVRNGTRGRGDGGPTERSGFTPASTANDDPLFRGIGSSRRPRKSETASTAATGVYSGGAGSRLPTRGYEGGRVPTSAPESGRSGGLSARTKAGGNGSGGGGGEASSRAASSWAQLGPRAVTREDLTRLDDEIANLSKTVEQVRLGVVLLPCAALARGRASRVDDVFVCSCVYACV